MSATIGKGTTFSRAEKLQLNLFRHGSKPCPSQLFSKLGIPSHRLLKHRHVFFWDRANFHLQIHNNVRGLSFGQQQTVADANQFIAEVHQRLAHVPQIRADKHLIVVTGRRFVAAASVHDRDAAAIILFHFTIRKTQLSQKFHPSHFKPDKVIRVIDHAHLIGLGVAYAYLDLAHATRKRIQGGCILSMWAHRPLQRGLRFSRNELIPSRKSAVWRMAAFSSMDCSIWRSRASAMKPLMSFFVSRTEEGLFSIICDASSRARSRRLSSAITSLTKP